MIFLRNLGRTPGRTLLTLLGASVGIAVFVVLTSIGVRVRSGLQAVIGRYEGDIVVQTARAATPPGSRIPIGDSARLGALDGVESAMPVVVGSVRMPQNPFFLLFGAQPEIFRRFGLTRGRPFSGTAQELLLGEVAFRSLGLRLGDMLSLAGRPFLIVGTYDTGAAMLDGGCTLRMGASNRCGPEDGRETEDSRRRLPPSLIGPHQLRLRQDMPLHRPEKLDLRCARLQP